MYVRYQLAVTLGLLLGTIAQAQEKPWTPLIQGNDPHQFELVGIGPESLKIENGEISLKGRPHGYFATKNTFHNYVLEFEWRYERPTNLVSDAAFDGNSGLLIHGALPHKVWPKSIEAQLFHPDAGHLFAIHGAHFQGEKDTKAQKRALKPVGQWNRQVIVCKDGAITCQINGVEVSRGTGASPDRGFLAWQAEGQPIRFRNLRIRPED